MRLVSDWRSAWRWFSVQALALVALLPVIWAELPPDLREWVPEAWRPWIVAAIAAAGLVGRIVDQRGRR